MPSGRLVPYLQMGKGAGREEGGGRAGEGRREEGGGEGGTEGGRDEEGRMRRKGNEGRVGREVAENVGEKIHPGKWE